MGPELRPTERGYAVAAIAIVAALMGWGFGGRALNAVVMPSVTLLTVGAIGVARVGKPRVERRAPEHGHVDERLDVELAVDGERAVTVTLHDELPEGLAGETTFETVTADRIHTYEVDLLERGVHEIGPARAVVTDVFGLWKRTFTYETRSELVAYPRIHVLYEGTDILSGYVGLTNEREQFDGLREYRPGDAVRNIDWKSSAKRNGELVVTEYAGEGAINNVIVAVRTTDESVADATVEAAASIATFLLDGGLAVGALAGAERVDPGVGDAHRRRLLSAFARFEHGERQLPTEDADIVVEGRPGRSIRVHVEGGTHRFGDLVARRAGTPTRGSREAIA